MGIFLWILAAFFGFLSIFLLIPARVRLRYDAGLTLWLGAGPLTFRVWPQKKGGGAKKTGRKRPKKDGRQAAQSKAAAFDLRPRLTLEALTGYAELGRKSLGRALCTVRIRRLRLHAVVAARDPGQVALAYGGAAAALGAVIPGLEGILNWRQTDILVEADFSGRASVTIDTVITILPIVALAAVLRGLLGYLKINAQADRKTAGQDALAGKTG